MINVGKTGEPSPCLKLYRVIDMCYIHVVSGGRRYVILYRQRFIGIMWVCTQSLRQENLLPYGKIRVAGSLGGYK